VNLVLPSSSMRCLIDRPGSPSCLTGTLRHLSTASFVDGQAPTLGHDSD
jgi:hypothetical protein